MHPAYKKVIPQQEVPCMTMPSLCRRPVHPPYSGSKQRMASDKAQGPGKTYGIISLNEMHRVGNPKILVKECLQMLCFLFLASKNQVE